MTTLQGFDSPYSWEEDEEEFKGTSVYNSTDRKDIATEILKGMVSSGLMDSPEAMADEAVKLADALLDRLRK